MEYKCENIVSKKYFENYVSMSINKRKFRKCMPLLKILNKISEEDRKNIISFLNDEGCEVLINCIQNTLYNPKLIKATKPLRASLIKHKTDFANLLKPKKSVKQKKLRLVQVGGNPLGTILSTLLPILAAFI